MSPTARLCDRCGAMASIAYRKPDAPDWDFCKHHAREVDVVLRGLGYTRQTLEAMIHSG